MWWHETKNKLVWVYKTRTPAREKIEASVDPSQDVNGYEV